MTDSDLVKRKDEHLDIVLRAPRAGELVDNGFSRWRFEHCALPELHLDQIDLSTPFLGKRVRAPILISSMTGGARRAARINHHLAEAAEALGIALAVGSQRVALEAEQDRGLTRELRRLAPSVPLLANLGAAQVRDRGPDWGRRAVDMIQADALIVHLNPLQEAVQRGGDRDWRGILDGIEQLAASLPVPIVAKEVGSGISAPVARALINAGVSVIDLAGAGGTSWARMEAERAATEADRRVALAFADWGIPTADALVELHRALPDTPLIASGGIRDGVDTAKAIRLGANLVGQAAAALPGALRSTQAVIEHFDILIRQLRIACFCTGSPDLAALRQTKIVRYGESPVPLA